MDVIRWVSALLPILLLLLLLIRFRWGGDEAAVIGLITAVVTGIWVFNGGVGIIALAVAKGMWNALSIIFVVIPALAIYEVSREAGAFNVIRQAMQAFTSNKVLQVLAIGWLFVSFLQGITGFGVPVVVGAPLLVGIGVKPLHAIMITLLGQAWGNTFGTLGLAWDGLIAQVDLKDPVILQQTILWSAGMLGVVNFIAGLLIALIAGGYKGLKQNFLLIALLALFQGAGQYYLALQNPMLSNFLVASISFASVFLVARLPFYRKVSNSEELQLQADAVEQKALMSLHTAFIPYYVLVVSAVFVLFNENLKDILGQWKLGFAFVAKTTGLGFSTKAVDLYYPFTPLLHSGTFLFLAAVAGFLYYRRRGYIRAEGVRIIIRNIWAKTIPSSIAVIGLIAMSKVMDDTGQTGILAQGVAQIAGTYYPIMASFIGLLGTFMTSSNLSSNILFGRFQQSVAEIIGANKAPILAAQTVGGSIGSIIAPSKVLLGTATVGMLGKEGEVIRGFLAGALALVGVIGLVIWIVI